MRPIPDLVDRGTLLFFATLAAETPRGAIVEVGTGRGGTLAILDVLFLDRCRIGYDTFGAFPSPTAEDYAEGQPDPTRQRWSYPLATMVNLFPGVLFRPGNIAVTYEQHREPIALLHIDVDYAEGTRAALKLVNWVVAGGWIVVDDYSAPEFPGVKIACDEYFKQSMTVAGFGAYGVLRLPRGI